MSRPKKLTNIAVEEVSIVDEPATRRQFMFWKAADAAASSAFEKKFKSLRVEFESDGTAEGSSLSINGKAIADMESFTLSAAPGGESVNLYCVYTQGAAESADGFKPSHTYALYKALNEEAANVSVAKAANHIDPDDISTVQAYMDELPPQLRRSVENLIGAAQASPGEPVAKEEGATVPEQVTQDGVVPPAPTVDLTEVTSKLDKLVEAMGAVAGKVTALETTDKQRQAAADQAAKEAAQHEAAVAAGDEVKFETEDDALAAIAAEANEDAVKEADEAP